MQEIVAKLEDQMRSGRGHQVRQELSSLPKGKIPRKHIASFAGLARRAGMPYLALRLLNPVIRANEERGEQASYLELAEYGESLNRVGACTEALEILRQVPHQELPIAAFFEALALFAQWKYKEAIPLLQFYSNHSAVSDYQRVVGRVNLAAALINADELLDAEKLLKSITDQCQRENLQLLYGNCLELSGQVNFFRNELSKADHFFSRSAEVFSNSSLVFGLFTRKWQAITALKRNSNDTKYIDALRQVRGEAIERKHWESVRDCDLFRAAITQDEALLKKVYFGSPYADYRERVVKIFGSKVEFGSHYLWQPGDHIPWENPKIFDVTAGKYMDDKKEPKGLGRKPHLTFWSLTSDFYKPVRVAEIFSKVCPNEFFDPEAGPNRIYQLMNRCRQWVDKNHIPIEIKEEKWAYRMQSVGPVAIRVSKDNPLPDRNELILQNLFSSIGKRDFRANEVKEILATSNTTVSKILGIGIAKNRLIKLGNGPTSRYRFTL